MSDLNNTANNTAMPQTEDVNYIVPTFKIGKKDFLLMWVKQSIKKVNLEILNNKDDHKALLIYLNMINEEQLQN